jgi:predicted nucleic acid-binding protein
MVIVDTTVVIDYLNGVVTPQTAWFDREATRQRLGLVDLTVCEVLQGLRSDSDAARVLSALREFEIYSTGGLELAVLAAKHYRDLRGRGRTVRRTIDCLIATFCLQEGHALLHTDRDFDAFEEVLGLTVVHPGSAGP